MKARLIAAALSGLFYTVFFLLLLQARGGDVSIMVVAGGPGVDATKTPPGLTVTPGIGGYDGVVFYRLALDPFTREQTAHGITLDRPAYRQQRIVYPLLVWLVSLGDARRVPMAMVGVNLIALVAIGWVGAAIAQKTGAPPLAGVVFAFYPGFLLSLARDLSEIVACAFVLGALLALSSSRWWLSGVLFMGAVLTRETTLLFVAAVCLAWIYQRVRRIEPRIEVAAFAIPLIAWVAWQLVLFSWWGTAGVRSVTPAWTVPLTEFGRLLVASSARTTHPQRVYFAECVFLIAIAIAVFSAWRKSSAPIQWRAAWLMYLLFGSVLDRQIWMEDFSFLRVLGEWFLASYLIVITGSAGIRMAVTIATFALWIYLAQSLVVEPR